jgi:hypothetical protein
VRCTQKIEIARRFGPPDVWCFEAVFFTLDSMAIDPAMKLPYSTRFYNGDDAQASHWADTPIGIMVPDLGPGMILDVSALDVWHSMSSAGTWYRSRRAVCCSSWAPRSPGYGDNWADVA